MPRAEIEILARRMRSAIEKIPHEKLPLTMSSFPVGSCGDVSLLLGAYFSDCGIDGFQYVSGCRGRRNDNTWESHAWLARESLIVDITADQFDDGPREIIVSEKSAWHRAFEKERGQPSDFRVWSGPGIHHLHVMYALLRPSLFEPT